MKARNAVPGQLLADRFRSGDHAAFNEIVSCYWSRIYAAAHRLLHNAQDAEEITQDVFIHAHRGLEKFRGESSLATWLGKIAINLAHNRYWYWRRRKRDRTVSLDQPAGDGTDTPLSEVFPAESGAPGDIIGNREFVEHIASAMKRLKASQHEILVFRAVKNLSYEEIAVNLCISIGTVKSRISRAREALKAELGAEFNRAAYRLAHASGVNFHAPP